MDPQTQIQQANQPVTSPAGAAVNASTPDVQPLPQALISAHDELNMVDSVLTQLENRLDAVLRPYEQKAETLGENVARRAGAEVTSIVNSATDKAYIIRQRLLTLIDRLEV